MKAAVIINPKSASGNTVKMWREIQASIQRSLGTIEVLMTEYPHHATTIAKEIAQKKELDCLIVMGGDGSIHEVINGLIDENGKVINPKLKIGILNSGRGCDFIRTLGVPIIAGEAVSKLVDGNTKSIDVAQIKINREDSESKGSEIHYFINSFSYGLGGEVARNIQRNESMFSPTTTYFIASTMGFLKSKPFKIEFSINDEKPFTKECMNIFVMNGRYSGGGMHWAPPARLDDGLVDLIIIEKLAKLKLAMVTPKVYDGTFLGVKEVVHKQIQKVRIKSSKDMFLEMDGEVTSARDIEISVLPKAIQFIC